MGEEWVGEWGVPTYFSSVDNSGRPGLCLAERGDLFVPRTRTTRLGRRSFFIAAPVVWNSLPLHIRSPSISRSQFRAGLKTHLFRLAFHWLFLWELLKRLNWTELNWVGEWVVGRWGVGSGSVSEWVSGSVSESVEWLTDLLTANVHRSLKLPNISGCEQVGLFLTELQQADADDRVVDVCFVKVVWWNWS